MGARNPSQGFLRRAARSGRRSESQGVGLLEVMIATLILTIVVLGMVEFFAKGRKGFDMEERKRVATLLAQEAVERTTARPYDQIAPWSENRTVANIVYAVTVATVENQPESEMKTIRSTVTWQATPTAQRSVSLATLVYDH
jgi:Tfp pilus assembly protein PilV